MPALQDIFEAPLQDPPGANDLVQAAMSWHFSPSTGSPYWLQRARTLDFDPLRDVRGTADLHLFDGVGNDWQTVPVELLVPGGCPQPRTEFSIYESGGTTGPPKRVVDATSRLRNMQWCGTVLDDHGFPGKGDGNWLHVGPTGPHVISRDMRYLAMLRGHLCHHIDLDPRWVKRCVAEQRHEEYGRYLDHILDQARDVLASQDIRVISTTPKILESIATRADVRDLVTKQVRGIIWGGTSTDAETLRLLETEVFPDAVIVGGYGNTMMGLAPQRARRSGDPAPCIFRPFYPYMFLDVVDPGQPDKPVPIDTGGQVKLTVLTRECFLPPTLERDYVIKRAPVDGNRGIDVSEVRPLENPASVAVEGVY